MKSRDAPPCNDNLLLLGPTNKVSLLQGPYYKVSYYKVSENL